MAKEKDTDSELEQNIEETSAQEDNSAEEDVASGNSGSEQIEDELPTEKITQKNEVLQEAQLDETSDDQVQEMITVRPVKFQQFELTEPNRSIKKNLDIMQDVSMHISVELGKTKSTIKEVMDMEEGSIVELDKIAGEQVEVYVNNKLVAKGEVIVIEDKFGVRVTSTNLPKTIQ